MSTPQSAPSTQALAAGALGAALLPLERRDPIAAGPLIEEAVAGGVSTGANASLFHGAPALEFVLGRAGRSDGRVQAAVDQIVAARLAAARRRGTAQPPPLSEYDLVQGLTGLGALLLARTGASPLLTDVLAYVVSLASPLDAEGLLPGWWSGESPGHRGPPGDHGNNGMAHGIAGPLALLALATRAGRQVPGQTEAIGAFANWLERYGTVYWVTRDQLGACLPAPEQPLRPSWCYGSLGIARALQLAAIAIDDPGRRQAAEDSALAAVTDPARLDRVTDASLCHGWAGLLTVTRALAADSPTPGRFTASIQDIRQRLAAGAAALPTAGFLEGRAGAQLALDATNATGWTRVLLID